MADLKPFGSSGSDSDGALYRFETYTVWSRKLHRMMPFAKDVLMLFDSTVEEPVSLLSQVVSSAFHNGADAHYESVFGRGNGRLVTALAQRYGVESSQILTTTGVLEGLRQVLSALVVAGDRVLVETPCFDVLPAMAGYAGADVGTVQRSFPDYDLTPQALDDAICERTRMVILSNLHNPSGHWLGEERIAQLEAVARARGVWLVIDEVYADLARPVMTPLAVLPNLIRLNSLSKVFGLHGLRCGWMTAEPAVLERIAEHKASREFGQSKLAHAVAAAVMEEPKAFEEHARTVVARNRPVLEYHLKAMADDGVIEVSLPAYGCMAFPRMVDHADTLALAERLWRDHGLVSAPGEMFGAAGHMRLGMGTSQQSMDEGLARLHQALKTMRVTA